MKHVPRSSLATAAIGEDGGGTTRNDSRRLLVGVLRDAEEGFRRAPMAVRVSPYVISLIDWNDPIEDPIRRQFIPLASTPLPDHPRLTLDSLHEQEDRRCPASRIATRQGALSPAELPGVLPLLHAQLRDRPRHRKGRESRAGRDAQAVGTGFCLHRARPELEDIVISGGDAISCTAKNIELIGDALLDIPHLRRMRFATKGPAIMPMKILTDTAWVDALTAIVDRADVGQRVVVHTHFNAPRRSPGSRKAMNVLFERGLTCATRRCSSAASTTIRAA